MLIARAVVLASTASAAASAATTSSNARAAASTTYSTDDILYEDGTGKVLYSYYRSGNFHNAVDVGASGDGSARAVSWDYTYSIFDSKRESYVMRYDIDTGGSSASTSTAVTAPPPVIPLPLLISDAIAPNPKGVARAMISRPLGDASIATNPRRDRHSIARPRRIDYPLPRRL